MEMLVSKTHYIISIALWRGDSYLEQLVTAKENNAIALLYSLHSQNYLTVLFKRTNECMRAESIILLCAPHTDALTD